MGEIDRYREVYKSLDYGPVTTARGLTLSEEVVLTVKPCKVLCVGSGNSYEAVNLLKHGFDVYTADYHHPRVKRLKSRQVYVEGKELPFKDDAFNLVFCCECIEHVPEEDIDQFMLELKRVGTTFFLTIADMDDPPYHLHLCVHDASWWFEKLAGWGIRGQVSTPIKVRYRLDGRIMSARYKHGIKVIATKNF